MFSAAVERSRLLENPVEKAHKAPKDVRKARHEAILRLNKENVGSSAPKRPHEEGPSELPRPAKKQKVCRSARLFLTAIDFCRWPGRNSSD